MSDASLTPSRGLVGPLPRRIRLPRPLVIRGMTPLARETRGLVGSGDTVAMPL